MLQALRQLHQLQRLRLGCVRLHVLNQQQLAACSAPTASPRLTELDIVSGYAQALPRLALHHAFKPSRQLRALEALVLYVQASHPDERGVVGAAELDKIARCCPALNARA